MKKALLILAGAVAVLLVVAVVAVPALVDWNAYRPEIAARLERDLGRRVEISGDLSLSLLPRPSIAAQGIRLGAGRGDDRVDLDSVEQLHLQVKLLPLLTGQIVIEDLLLVGPVVVVHTVGGARDTGPQASGDAPSPQPQAPTTKEEASEFVVRRVAVQNGRVLVRGREAVPLELVALDGTVEAGEDGGPLRATGTFDWRGNQMAFDVSTGNPSLPQMPISASLRQIEPVAELRLSGQLDRRAAEPSLKGKLAISGKDLQRVLATLAGIDSPPTAAAAFVLDGELAATPQAIDVQKAGLRVGETEGGGSLGLGLGDRPRLDVVLGFSRLDLDRWLSESTDAAGSPEAGRAVEQAPAKRGDEAFSLDTPLAVAADLSAEALVYRGAIMRRARVAATLDGGILHIGQAGALLPGGAEVSVAGTVAAQDGRPVFDGRFESTADNLRETLRWLGVDAGEIPADRLRLFSATGKLAGGMDEVHLRDLDLALDASRVSGAVTFRPGPRPSFGANLVADTLNADAYMPRQAVPTGGGGQAGAAGVETPAQLKQDRYWTSLFTLFDANLRARVGQLTLNDVTVGDLLLDGTLFNGDLTVRRASIGEVGGTNGRVSGVVEGIGRGDLVVRDLAYELRSAQPERALRLLGLELPVDPEQLGSLALTGTVDGGAEGLTVKMRAETAGGVVNIDGSIAEPLMQPRYRFAAEASHANFAEVVRLAAPSYRPRGRLGGFALSMQIDGDATAATLGDVRAKLGPVNAAGSARVAFAERPHLTGEFTTGAVPFGDFLPPKQSAAAVPVPQTPIRPVALAAEPTASGGAWSREPMDMTWLRSFDANLSVRSQTVSYDEWLLDAPALDMVVRDGALALERLAGVLFGGQLALRGRLTADGAASAVLDVAGAHLQRAPLRAGGVEVAGGTVDTAWSIATQGRSMMEMMSRLQGEGSLSARNGVIRGVNIGEISQRLHNIDNIGDVLAILDAGRSGSTPYSKLAGTFRIANGILGTDDLALQAEGGTAQGVATVNLPRYTIDGRVVFRLTEHPRAPSFVMLLRGPLDEPRREFDTAELQAWLAGRGVQRLMERSGRAGRVGEVIEKVAPGLLPGGDDRKAAPESPPPAQQLLEGLMQQFGR